MTGLDLRRVYACVFSPYMAFRSGVRLAEVAVLSWPFSAAPGGTRELSAEALANASGTREPSFALSRAR